MDDRTITNASSSSDDGEPAPAPERVDRYRILGELGRGGMGTVYAAHDPELDRKVALKLLHAVDDTDRLRREARVLARLSHENVVRIFDVGMDDDQPFVVMELVEGRTLRQWMCTPGRRWPEVVRMLEAAGRGLAAAHAVGIVHRDFKPGNVLIGDDGRPRVVDFGLARSARLDLLAHTTSAEHRDGVALDSVDLEAQLTETGAVVGTPAYMAPEQWRGHGIDPRTDVFSFCVTAWEALYGVRPFQADSARAIARRVMHGDIEDPPAGADVPAWLEAALRRGLHADAALRWPGMEALLQALVAPPPRRRRRVALAAGALLVATAGTLLAVQGGGDERRCESVAAPMDELWTPARRAELATGIREADLAHAELAWERIEPRLDAYAGAWVEARQEACEAHQPGDPASEHELDLRMTCLERRRVALATLLDVLGGGAPETIENGPGLTWRLPAIDDCRDLETLRQREDRPADPAVREALAGAHERLERAKVLVAAGRYAEALQAAEAVFREAERLGWTPLSAEVRLLQGQAMFHEGRFDDAEQRLREAYDDAIEAGRDDLALAAASDRIHALGETTGRLREADDAIEQAEAAWRRTGEQPRDRVRLLLARGRVGLRRGEYPEARRSLEQALAIQRELELDGPPLADSLANLASLEQIMGDLEPARAHMVEALEIRERTEGSMHPKVALDLHNLAVIHAMTGELDRAQVLLERSLALKIEVLGRDHAAVPHTLVALGNVAMERGRWAEAERFFHDAIERIERLHGKDSPELYYPLVGLVEVQRGQDALGSARAPLLRAIAVLEETSGPEHPELAIPLRLLGELELGAGNPAAAVEHLRRSLRLDAAVVQGPADTADRRFLLARALWALGTERPEAVALARAVLAELPPGDAQQQALRAEVERWLAERPWPPP